MTGPERRPGIEHLIRLFELKPHPEGGFYGETYRASGVIPEGLAKGRNFSTAIFFLLPEGAKSSLHRIKWDEVWHYHLGGALRVWRVAPDGAVSSVVLGPDVLAGQKLQLVIPAGVWFGAEPEPGSGYTLAGCTVAPGFDFADFELGERAALLSRFPHARDVIERLT